MLCSQYNKNCKYTQFKHNFILQIKQIDVSVNHDSHHQAVHKNIHDRQCTYNITLKHVAVEKQ
jgi:hypothetical protein